MDRNRQLSLGTTLLFILFSGCNSASIFALPPSSPAKSTPSISWTTPAAIPTGSALTSKQLNAAASVPGTFTYSPAAGTVLNAGASTLSAVFTPTDTASYTTASRTVTITAGRTFYVSPTGSDTATGQSPTAPFRTLQHAADSTLPGDFVYAMGGSYSSSNALVLGISKPGSPNAWITYQPWPGATPVIQTGNPNWAGVRFTGTAAYITLTGFTILGNDPNVTFAQAQADENDPGSHPEVNGSCIDVDGQGRTGHPHHIRILANTVASCPGAGIGTTFSDYITISGNTVYSDAFYSAYGQSGITTLGDFDTDPADTATPYKMLITGNTLYNNQELIPVLANKPPLITDGEAIIIDSNKNSAYIGSGIPYPPYAGRTLIANNVIYENGSAAIEVFQSAHVDVVNNSTYGDVRVPAVSGRGEMNLNIASDVNILNNIFSSAPGQNPIAIINPCTGGCTLDYNLYFGGANQLTAIAPGLHDLVADPLYVTPPVTNTATANLHLKPSSPAIGSGTHTLAPATDILGNPRNPSNPIDRGAYQH